MPLKPHNISDPKPSGKVWVFPEGFMTPSPPWVTEDVHIGGPEGQPLINIRIPAILLHIKLGPCLSGHHIRHLLHHILIKSRRHSHSLGKYCGCACPGNAVKGFIPPIIFFNSQTLNSRRLVQGLLHFLL